MLSYVLAGLGLGSIYAIAAGSLVITYVASGIFNLAFAAMAYSVARFYYFLLVEEDWAIIPAAIVSLFVFAPALGMFLYAVLFRHLRLRSTLVKLMATVGLSVALPPLINLWLEQPTDPTAPGLAPRPLATYDIFGSTINADQLATYIGLVVVLIVGVGLLRFTNVGLKVRALVDSEALTSLSGTSPGRVSLGVWAASATLAGLAGILIAPTAGLSVGSMTFLMSAAFAAVVAAKLRSLPLAVGVALLMGVATNVVQKYIDPSSDFGAAVVPSIPFAFMLLFLLFYALRGQAGDLVAGGALDRAIATQGGDPSVVSAVTGGSNRLILNPGVLAGVIFVGIVAFMPGMLDRFWSGLLAGGIAIAIALLSYTLVTGEGGMVWLSQITFAGGGAVLAAELVRNYEWDPLVAVLLGAVFIVPVGVIIGLLTIRLGNLYVALVTLTFGSLIQTLVFARDPFYNFGSGQPMPRPEFATTNDDFAYLGLAVFVILAILIVNVRRSTAGLAMSAVRFSENGAKTLGISVVQTKVLVSGLATYTAAVGGGFIAMNAGSTLPDSFNPTGGLVWLAVLVTMGARSNIAALIAGIMFVMMPQVFSTYVSHDYADVPIILFGLGALGLALHPEGVVIQTGNNIMKLFGRGRRTKAVVPPGTPGASGPSAHESGDVDATPGSPVSVEKITAGGQA
ncbi:ABC transporter permease [Trujillonella endophytica]|uniref:Branched-chain amino acid ABC-type transport system, permease component n=1 Tax=Trujillonella endophytica TaxID=673521 RepID=A0A1H8W7H2_9ACTN|nr:ABC transporter permease [Trujillella endophytica]SEP23367.1 Branched-chain amino acid ABC-type transport system, permease component [Trujillella endophytica]